MKIDLHRPDRLTLKGSTKILSSVLVVMTLIAISFSLFAGFSGYPAGWIVAPVAAVLGGGILWLVFHRTEAVFDRETGTLTFRKTMLHGAREEVISLDEVRQADVDLQRSKTNNNRLHARYTYRLCIVTGTAQNAHRMPLSHGYTTNNRHLYTAQKINDWLGVPEAPIAKGPSMADVQQVLRSLGLTKAS